MKLQDEVASSVLKEAEPDVKYHWKCHCVKSVQIRSYFWSVFPRIWTEYGEIQSIGHFSRSAGVHSQ